MAGKIYFASDFHLGVPNYDESRIRERIIVDWLDMAAKDAEHIYLVGDIFDFWFEYKHVVPKGYIRLFGKLAELRHRGIPVTVFRGNHDMWMFGYFERELGIPVISDELEVTHHGRKFFIHHGDGLGPGDASYKLLRKIFRNRFCQRLFAALHPSWGFGLAKYFSSKSRIANHGKDDQFEEEKEWLIQFCKNKIRSSEYDYMVFGHRHLPLDIKITEQTRYINLGEWVHHYTYAVCDNGELSLLKYEHENIRP